MAEGCLRALSSDRFEVSSAGTEATRVHPLAVRAMAEVGVDLSGHTSKTLDQLVGEGWDWVTLAGWLAERGPAVTVTRRTP